MKRLAYIPARGGSKGIPGKNICALNGVPLISYTINAAKASGLFDMIFVSTDSDEIAEIAKAYGAEVPFLRDPEFAQDHSKTIDAVVSDKARLEALGRSFDLVTLLQVTSPLRTVQNILEAHKLYESSRVIGGLLSLSPVDDHPILMRTINADGSVSHILNVSSTVRRQDLPPVYKVNGAIYINTWDEVEPSLSFNDNRVGYIMDANVSVDIDSLSDLAFAEAILISKQNVHAETSHC